MTIEQLIASLSKLDPSTIVVLQRSDSNDYSPLSGIDTAQCSKTCVDDDAGIHEDVADCVILYLAE